MATMYTIELNDYPRAILVQGGAVWRQVVGIGDPPCVAKVNLTLSFSTRARAVELTLEQARALVAALQGAIVEAEQVTAQRNENR